MIVVSVWQCAFLACHLGSHPSSESSRVRLGDEEKRVKAVKMSGLRPLLVLLVLVPVASGLYFCFSSMAECADDRVQRDQNKFYTECKKEDDAMVDGRDFCYRLLWWVWLLVALAIFLVILVPVLLVICCCVGCSTCCKQCCRNGG